MSFDKGIHKGVNASMLLAKEQPMQLRLPVFNPGKEARTSKVLQGLLLHLQEALLSHLPHQQDHLQQGQQEKQLPRQQQEKMLQQC